MVVGHVSASHCALQATQTGAAWAGQLAIALPSQSQQPFAVETREVVVKLEVEVVLSFKKVFREVLPRRRCVHPGRISLTSKAKGYAALFTLYL